MSTHLRLVALTAIVAALTAPAWANDAADDDDDVTGAGVVIHGPPPPVAPAIVSRDDQGRVTLRASRIAEPIIIDGKLDDAAYARIPAVSDFIQQEPNEGEIGRAHV